MNTSDKSTREATRLSKRLIAALAIPSILLAGVVGYAATSPALTMNSALLNSAPCTVTLSGASYSGTFSPTRASTAASSRSGSTRRSRRW